MKKLAVAIAIALASTGAFASSKVETCTDLMKFVKLTSEAKGRGVIKEVVLAVVEEGLTNMPQHQVEFTKAQVEAVYSNKYKSAVERDNQVMLGCLKTF